MWRCLFLSLPFILQTLSADEPISRIAFGSCCHQDKPAPIFTAIVEDRPDVFIWAGDNIYGDSADMSVMRKKYRMQFERPGYAALREVASIIGTWDDHDFGVNNGGKEYSHKAASQQVALDFLGVPKDDPRRQREGLYSVAVYGTGAQSVKILLLDTRYHREKPGAQSDILGEAQWAWLEEQLIDSPAAVHVIVSGIQILASEHRFEKWANFPTARRRLLALLAQDNVPPVVLISGDRHHGELSKVEVPELGYALYDITSSGLTQGFAGNINEINTRRDGLVYGANHYGMLTIDWSREAPVLTAMLCAEDGTPVRAASWMLAR